MPQEHPKNLKIRGQLITECVNEHFTRSQKQFAARCNISDSTLSRILTDQYSHPKSKAIKKIANLLIEYKYISSPDEIFEDENSLSANSSHKEDSKENDVPSLSKASKNEPNSNPTQATSQLSQSPPIDFLENLSETEIIPLVESCLTALNVCGCNYVIVNVLGRVAGEISFFVKAVREAFLLLRETKRNSEISKNSGIEPAKQANARTLSQCSGLFIRILLNERDEMEFQQINSLVEGFEPIMKSGELGLIPPVRIEVRQYPSGIDPTVRGTLIDLARTKYLSKNKMVRFENTDPVRIYLGPRMPFEMSPDFQTYTIFRRPIAGLDLKIYELTFEEWAKWLRTIFNHYWDGSIHLFDIGWSGLDDLHTKDKG